MSRVMNVRTPTEAEIREVSTMISTIDNPRALRRANIILLLGAGLSAADMARSLGVHINTVYSDIHAFAETGIAAAACADKRGAPRRLSAEVEAEIQRLVEIPPYELGLPYGRWSLTRLRSYLLKQRLLPTISREHLRQVLKKGGSSCVASSARSRAVTRNERPF